MKKAKILSISAIFACMAAMAGKPLTLNAENGLVSTSSIEAWKFAGGWEISSSYVDSGVKFVIPGASSVGSGDAWKYKATINNDGAVSPSFSLKHNEKISFELSAKLFDDAGNQISKSQNSDALDIYMHNKADGSQLALLRIWTGSAGGTNGSHSYLLHGNNWNGVSGATWIAGDARENSSFLIQFDKQNLFSSYVGGSDQITRLDDADNNYLNTWKDSFANVDEVYFVIQGENGFTNDTEFVIKSINGQSLANSNGNFTDNVAPTFKDATVAATLNANEEYTIPTEAFDLFGAVSYSLKVGDNVIDGRTFTPTEAGALTVTLNATDAAGNVATKDYTFNVVSTITAPVITTLPEIKGTEVSLYETLVFGKPVFEDETGAATVVLKVYKGEEEVLVLQENEAHQFAYTVDPSFASGEYKFVFEVTNAGGTTVSEAVLATFTTETTYPVEFVSTSHERTVADLASNGVRVRSDVSWTEAIFGVFDITHGLDVKYVIPEVASNGINNPEGACLNLKLVNQEDPNYQVMYRVWAKYAGADAPTNVYISTDAGKNFRDITDTGWISRSVDEVTNQYRMLFTAEDTFSGERTGGVTRVDNAYDALVEFFNNAPSSNYALSFQMGHLAAPTGNFEYTVTEINGQKLASTQGVVNEVKDAFLHVNTAKEAVALNDVVTYKAYSKDLFAATPIKLVVTKPDATTEEVEFVNGEASYTYAALGNYKVKVVTVGSNEKEVAAEYDVVCKSSTAEIELNAPTDYAASYDLNSKVTIKEATYSENVVEKLIVVTKPNGEKVNVNANDEFTFDKPGIYKITYIARDAAEPEPNEKQHEITINVPDLAKPVVEVTVGETITLNEKLVPTIEITEDSEYDVTVTITKPDGSVENLSASNAYEYTFAAEGTYTLKVVVEDIYGNKETVTKEITVSAAQENPDQGETPTKPEKGCKGSATTGVVALAALATALVSRKRKNK